MNFKLEKIKQSVLFPFLFVPFLVSCGGGSTSGGGNSLIVPPRAIISGVVQAPNGQLAFEPHQNLFERAVQLIVPPANALISGITPVPDGTTVELDRINNSGKIVSTLSTTTTVSGNYSFDLTQFGFAFSSDLIVRVINQQNGVQMRAFVGIGVTNITPVSELAVRIILDKVASAGVPLSNFTPQEQNDFTASIDLISVVNKLSVGPDIESTINIINSNIVNDLRIIAFLASISQPGQTNTGPGDIGNFFPFSIGTESVYQTTDSPSSSTPTFFVTTDIYSGTKIFNGIVTTVQTETSSNLSGTVLESYLVKNSVGIYQYGDNQLPDFTSKLFPIQFVQFPLQPGRIYGQNILTGLDYGSDIDGDGVNETVDESIQSQVIDFESVTTLEGGFSNSVKIETKSIFIVTLSKTRQKLKITLIIDNWFSSGLGNIKTVRTTQIFGPNGYPLSSDTYTEELIGSHVNNTVSGSNVGTNTLTVTTTGSGSGTIISDPVGIACQISCSASFASGTLVTLTALPNGGSNFGGWSGGVCTGTVPCTFTFNGATNIQAAFNTSGNTVGSSWTTRALGVDLNTVVSSPNIIVAVGASGTVLTSSDGITWKPRLSGSSVQINSVNWNGSQFLAVGGTGLAGSYNVFTSPDGITWTPRAIANSVLLRGITWSGSQYVAVGFAGTILTSPDGITWTRRISPTPYDLNGVTSNGSQYVAVGGHILSSPDGINWTIRFDPGAAFIYGISWNGTKFVAVGDSVSVVTSPDGINWTWLVPGPSASLFGVAWNGGQFVAVGMTNLSGAAYKAIILTSPDGVTWTSRISFTNNVLFSVTWTGSQFVAVGMSGTILTSPDGITWTIKTPGISATVRRVIWSGSQYVAVGDSGTILTSPDAITWTPRFSGVAFNVSLKGLAWSGSQFVAVGDSGTILTSLDAITWTPRSSGMLVYLNNVTWGGNQFVAVGGGNILTSPDGITWTPRNPATFDTFYNVLWSGSQFVAVGFGGAIFTSLDGITWTSRYSSNAIDYLYGITGNEIQYVAVGGAGINQVILTSPDGVFWNQTFHGNTSTINGGLYVPLNGITSNGAVFVAVGNFGVVLSSTDGITWTPEKSGTVNALQDVIWGGNQLVAVGSTGTIITSP